MVRNCAKYFIGLEMAISLGARTSPILTMVIQKDRYLDIGHRKTYTLFVIKARFPELMIEKLQVPGNTVLKLRNLDSTIGLQRRIH